MEKLEFKTIKSADDIGLFLEKVEGYTNVKLPFEYAAKSKIVGVYSANKLVAGYMIVTQPTFRSLLFVPDKIRTSHEFFNNEHFEMMEVNGLWIGPALKTPSQQLRVWFKLVTDIFLSRKNYVLLMRDARNKTMDRFLSMAHPTKIYAGAPLLMSGQTTHSEIEVSYTTRWKIVLNFHKYFIELLRRQKRANLFAKSRGANNTTRAPESDLAQQFQ